MTRESIPQVINITLPLPSDQLLHLIQFNVYRAFISIKRTINTISLDPTTCPVFGPCLDDTTRYPPNPNILPSLAPTTLQVSQYHFPWINIMPFARLRDNLIRREGRFDNFELWRDLVGDLMSYTAAPWQRGTPLRLSTTIPETKQSQGHGTIGFTTTVTIRTVGEASAPVSIDDARISAIEAQTWSLKRQIELANPDILVCLGGPSAQTLLNLKEGIKRTRGKWFDFNTGMRTIRAIATFHPAYLLRSPLEKRLAWRDFLAIKRAICDMLDEDTYANAWNLIC